MVTFNTQNKGYTIPGTLSLNLFIFQLHLTFRNQCFCLLEPSNISQAAVVLDLESYIQLKAEGDAPQCGTYVRAYFPCLKARNGIEQLFPHTAA